MVSKNRSHKQEFYIAGEPMRKLIYMAGPDVFLPNAREIAQKKKSLALSYGFEGLHPFDNELETPQLQPQLAAQKIAEENFNLMRRANAIIANLTPFRGVSADVGTAFELGFMIGMNKPAYGYSNVSSTYAQRLQTLEGPLFMSPDGNLRDKKGMSVENFDLFDNLMLGILALQSTPRLILNSTSEDSLYSCLQGFERTLSFMASDLAPH
jgi:nucleoside 2-deoxyribosyltransferase